MGIAADRLKWVGEELKLKRRRVALGRINVELVHVADPSELVDSVDDEAFGEDERFPYWSEIWPSSLALAGFLSEKGRVKPGTPALELGCGTGLAGTAAAICGADVVFTDYESQALRLASVNHWLNLGKPGRTMLFDWRQPARNMSARLVIAADVLYEKRFLAPFRDTLKRVLAPGGTAWVAEPDRAIARGAVELLETQGFKRSLYVREVEMNGHTHTVWIHGIHRPATRYL